MHLTSLFFFKLCNCLTGFCFVGALFLLLLPLSQITEINRNMTRAVRDYPSENVYALLKTLKLFLLQTIHEVREGPVRNERLMFT